MCAHIGAGACAYARESYKYIIYIYNMRGRECERAGVRERVRIWAERATVQSCGALALGARSGAWFSRCSVLVLR